MSTWALPDTVEGRRFAEPLTACSGAVVLKNLLKGEGGCAPALFDTYVSRPLEPTLREMGVGDLVTVPKKIASWGEGLPMAGPKAYYAPSF